MKPTMIELMSGRGIMAEEFKQMGYDVLTIDLDKKCKPNMIIDINHLSVSDLPIKFQNPDVIWFGMDCTYFSQANTHKGGHIGPNGELKTKEAEEAVQTLKKGLRLIEEMNPKFWFIENPGGNGGMKRLKVMKKYPHVEIVYCAYGGKTKKPTSIFGKFPSKWIPKTVCSHLNHEESITNTKRKKLDRSEYPLLLTWDISYACYMSKTTAWRTLNDY